MSASPKDTQPWISQNHDEEGADQASPLNTRTPEDYEAGHDQDDIDENLDGYDRIAS
jgi:hypothetical protein